ncbi:MAG: hypothetical protein IKB15_06455 [Alistipes sp.]|nr:hypothetical protein [Alistipes sp.]
MRHLFVTLMALCSVVTLSAQDMAREWVDRLNASLGSRYAFGITVEVGDGDEALYGTLQVEGDSYYMRLADMEVYSDGSLRYEINNARKEVTEDRVNLESRDLLTNPTRAFAFVDEEFDMALRFNQNDEVVGISLTPKDRALGITNINLALLTSGDRVLPAQIEYDYDGDIVKITMTPIEGEWTLPRWDEDAYRAYDIVSFL